MTYRKVIFLSLFAFIVAGFLFFDLGQFLSLDYLKSRQAEFRVAFDQHPFVAGGGFFAAYVPVTAASLPGAAVMTLAAGALFGVWWGVIIVSIASSVGATLAMLMGRLIFREQVRNHFGRWLARSCMSMLEPGWARSSPSAASCPRNW